MILREFFEQKHGYSGNCGEGLKKLYTWLFCGVACFDATAYGKLSSQYVVRYLSAVIFAFRDRTI